ncbi:unnamed protein product [Cunninghamella blakesleeana]
MVIVDCKWPCPNPNSACIITNHSIQCQEKKNSQWIWIDIKKSPEYDGEPALKGEPCITIPQLSIPSSSLHYNQSYQTDVTWPPLDLLQPVDNYLSDCDQQTYCSQGICIPKLNVGDSCESSNQCIENHICQYKKCTPYQSSSTSPPSSSSSSSSPSSSSNEILEKTIEENHKTIQIILGVVISLFVIAFILVVYYLYKKWYRPSSSSSKFNHHHKEIINENNENNNNNNNNDHQIIPIQQVQHLSSNVNRSSSSSSSSSSSPSNNNNNNSRSSVPSSTTLHQDEPSMISPSIQQQQLQYKLQNQLPYTNDPPPSYHP